MLNSLLKKDQIKFSVFIHVLRNNWFLLICILNLFINFFLRISHPKITEDKGVVILIEKWVLIYFDFEYIEGILGYYFLKPFSILFSRESVKKYSDGFMDPQPNELNRFLIWFRISLEDALKYFGNIS